jgi:4-amino-4-deoxy-L-arabinose transferase-like glycosyltransferase
MPAADAPRPAEPLSDIERGSFITTGQFLGLLLGYFLLQIVLRLWISSSLDLDESEQLVLTQKLSWGYGSQPPLYTWIQWAFFKVFGPSVFGLSLLKNILLFCTYLLTYLNARLITGRPICGMAAAASLLFIPQIVWESQRDLTHSVLAAMLACATLFCFLRLAQNTRKPASEGGGGSIRNYALFGLCAGLGVLSKYNFALLLVALMLAAISMREFRAVVFNRRMLVAGMIAVLLILPNLTWALEHRNLALSAAGKFRIQESSHWFGAVISGFKGLIVCSVTFFAPLAVVYTLIFGKRRASDGAAERSFCGVLLWRMLLASYGLMVLAIVIFRISDVRDRWLLPILVTSPVLAVVWLQRRLDAGRLKWIFGIVLATFALEGRIIWAEQLHRTQPWNRPYDALAQEMKSTLAPASAVITDTTLLAGNLRLQLPDKTFTPPELAGLFAESNAPIAFAWDAGGDSEARKNTRLQARDWPPPDNLSDFAMKTGLGLKEAQARYFSATFKFHKTRQMKAGTLVIGNQ